MSDERDMSFAGIFQRSSELLGKLSLKLDELVEESSDAMDDPEYVLKAYDTVARNHVAVIDGYRKLAQVCRSAGEVLPASPTKTIEMIEGRLAQVKVDETTMQNSKFSGLKSLEK